jgi:hypothetical protein
MSYINYAVRQICCKIVYYGPGLSGKTANLKHLHAHTVEAARGRLVSLETESERTLFFDFMPIDLGAVAGYRVRLQLYTVPGQIFYRASRRLILRGIDGVVFVADSQPARLDANLESMDDLRDNLAEQGTALERLPFVIQYNKRDLEGVASLDELRAQLNPGGVPEFEAAATRGGGVFETLKAVSRLALEELRAGGKR